MLAAILLSADAVDRVMEILKAEYFYSDANGKIFAAALELLELADPFDEVKGG